MLKKSDIRERLSRLRRDRKESQDYISENILDVNRTSYIAYENQERAMNIDQAERLASHFGVSIDYLLCRSDFRTPENDYISLETGLSDDAIDKLKSIKTQNKATHWLDALNYLIEHPDFEYLLILLCANVTGGSLSFGDLLFTGDIRQETVIKKTDDAFDAIQRDIRQKLPVEGSDEYWKTHFYRTAYSLNEQGLLSDAELQDVISHYDNGDYDYVPKGFNYKERSWKKQHPDDQTNMDNEDYRPSSSQGWVRQRKDQ